MERPSLWRMLVRGAFRRCPWCRGRGAFFAGWFTKGDHCSSCGLRWRRDDPGFELGAGTMLVLMTIGPIVAVMAIMLAITWPEVHTVVMFAVLGTMAVAIPLVCYGSAYLIWQACDLAARRVTPDDFEIEALLDVPDDGRPPSRA